MRQYTPMRAIFLAALLAGCSEQSHDHSQLEGEIQELRSEVELLRDSDVPDLEQRVDSIENSRRTEAMLRPY